MRTSKDNMILISHRGNTEGINPDLENSPPYIESALNSGFNVEIDVWKVEGKIFLGHDKPQHEIEVSFLKNRKLWCHAKNLEALEFMLSEGKIRCFWHQEDNVTLTNDNYIWTYPGIELKKNSICVKPEAHGIRLEDIPSHCSGICSDFIINFIK